MPYLKLKTVGRRDSEVLFSSLSLDSKSGSN
jgi:hypothetical protein